MVKPTVKAGVCALLILAVLLGQATCALAPVLDMTDVLADTADCLLRTVQAPSVGSVGGEWAVLGLARSGCDGLPEDYFEQYYAAAEEHVTACGGVLHARKYTEYSRMIIALTAIGKDPTDVGGYNLLTALGDYEKTVWQGLNGAVWALIALDCGDYPMPENPKAETQATRERYLRRILSSQLSDGGFSLTGEGRADACITAMALQALSGYTDRSDVAEVVDRALSCLSGMQDQSGGFITDGVGDCESCAQTLIALCELGISPDDDRFVKNRATLVDNLISFYTGEEGFQHASQDTSSNQMATEQAFLALTALHRAASAQSRLYDIKQAWEQTGLIWNGTAQRRSLVSGYRKDIPARSMGR